MADCNRGTSASYQTACAAVPQVNGPPLGRAIVESGFRRNERNRRGRIDQPAYCATSEPCVGRLPETVRAATGDASIDPGVGLHVGAAQILETQTSGAVVPHSMRQVAAQLKRTDGGFGGTQLMRQFQSTQVSVGSKAALTSGVPSQSSRLSQ